MHKKLLPVLLALVMILSVLPMAAFAEEAEHTHDENCGCVTTLAVCTHSDYTDTGEVTYGYEAYPIDGYHLFCTYSVRLCTVCGKTFYHKLDWYREGHNEVLGKIYRGTTTIDGETYYVYECACSCGVYWYLYSSFPPPGLV